MVYGYFIEIAAAKASKENGCYTSIFPVKGLEFLEAKESLKRGQRNRVDIIRMCTFFYHQ